MALPPSGTDGNWDRLESVERKLIQLKVPGWLEDGHRSNFQFKGVLQVNDDIAWDVLIRHSSRGCTHAFIVLSVRSADQRFREAHTVCKVAVATHSGEALMEEKVLRFKGQSYSTQLCFWELIMRCHTLLYGGCFVLGLLVSMDTLVPMNWPVPRTPTASLWKHQATEDPTKCPTLGGVLLNMLASGTNSDITLVAQGMEFKAHMTHSNVFSVMFQADMEEKRQQRVVIEDMTAEELDALLKYLYGRFKGPIRNSVRVATALRHAAEKYNIAGLARICESSILQKWPREITLAEALSVFSCGHLFGVTALEVHAAKVFKVRWAEIGESEEFQEFAAKNPRAVQKLFHLAMSPLISLSK